MSDGPKVISSVEEVFVDWRPDQRLYVKGDLGVGESQLAGLEQWLDQNGTNWIIVLMDAAAGERFTDASGRSFRDMDAVEHRLGKGLPAQTEFGSWADSRTGERSGAFFVLFLKERKFSYYGSDVYDNRSLGENRWKGNLDKPAITAMRGGGRVVDAAKDTVSSIDQQLDRKIAAAERQVRQALEKAKAREARLESEAQGSYEAAQQQLSNLVSQVERMRESDSALTGEVVQPDVVDWTAQLASAESNLSRADYEASTALANEVIEGVSRAQQEIDRYRNAGGIMDGLESDLTRMRSMQYAGLASVRFEKADDLLAESRRLHATADPAYYASMERARAEITGIREFIRLKARQAQQQKEILILGSASALLVAFLIAFFLNRRRRSSRREALELIDAWKVALDEKRVSASSLMHRSMESLGVSRREAEARFSGTTLELVEQTIRDVDEMVIMANSAIRVLESADQLARSDAFGARLTNLFFKRRYLRAIKRLRNQPISFSPEDGLARVMNKQRTDRDRLLGELDSYRPFQLSFNALIHHFNERAERALDSLNQLEKGQLEIADLLINVKRSIDETQSNAEKMEAIESASGWFPVSDVLAELLPSAATAYSDAAVMSIKDPLGALDGVAKRSLEQSNDAREFVRLADQFETRMFPEMESSRRRLIEMDLSVDWVGQTLDDLSREFEQSIKNAIGSDQSISIGRIESQTNELLERVERVGDAERKRVEEVEAGIVQTEKRVADARAYLGTNLNLAPAKLLVEAGRDPDAYLLSAREQSSAARVAANGGDADLAMASNASALSEIQIANDLVEETKKVFGEHDGILGLRRAEDERLQKEVPVHETVLGEIESQYAASVLLLSAGDPAHPDANGTIRDNIREVEHLMATAHENIESSVKWFGEGRVLDSAIALDQTEFGHQLVVSRLEEIREKQDRLKKYETENRSLLELLLTRVGHLKALAEDRRTMRPSQENVERVERVARQLAEKIDAPMGDPFKLSAELNHLKGEIDNVEIIIQSDWREHAEVLRSIEVAQDQLASLGKLETQSATDNHPDSLLTKEILEQAGQLREKLGQLRSQSEEPHMDWDQLDDLVDNLARQAGLLAARLRKDLEAAEKAYNELRSAMNSVRSASRWSGGYGVLLASSYGAESLNQARHGFQRGDYSTVISAALLAKRMASQAIAQAEAEVRRRRDAEQRRIEQERRRRQAAARRIARSVSRSSFGSSSGSSRSSFGSGSGTSRSGW